MSTETKTEALVWEEGTVKVSVRAEVCDGLAVHPAIRLQDDPTGPREWKVTHMATGLCFPFGFRSRQYAMDAAGRILRELDLDHAEIKALVKRNKKKWESMRIEFLKDGQHA